MGDETTGTVRVTFESVTNVVWKLITQMYD
jgi:hypothetical protein